MQHFAQIWFGLMVDISIKSLLLAVAAGSVMLSLLRVRDYKLATPRLDGGAVGNAGDATLGQRDSRRAIATVVGMDRAWPGT